MALCSVQRGVVVTGCLPLLPAERDVGLQTNFCCLQSQAQRYALASPCSAVCSLPPYSLRRRTPCAVAQASIDRKRVKIASLEGHETTEISVEVPPAHGGEGSGYEKNFIQVVTGPGAYMVVQIPAGLGPGQAFQVNTVVQKVPAAECAAPDASGGAAPPPVAPPPPYEEHDQHETVAPPAPEGTAPPPPSAAPPGAPPEVATT